MKPTSCNAQISNAILHSLIKGLVSQQVDSFNDFQETTVQDLIDEYSHISLDQNNPPDSTPDRPIAVRRYELKLGHIAVSRPVITEGEGTMAPLLPYELRYE